MARTVEHVLESIESVRPHTNRAIGATFKQRAVREPIPAGAVAEIPPVGENADAIHRARQHRQVVVERDGIHRVEVQASVENAGCHRR